MYALASVKVKLLNIVHKSVYVEPSCVVTLFYSVTVHQCCMGSIKSMLSPQFGHVSHISCVGAVTCFVRV